MASADLKEAIVHYFNCTNVQSNEKDWKRVRKFALNGDNWREFHNTKLNRTVFTIGDDEDASLVESDQWIYGVWYDDDGMIGSIAFETMDRFSRCGHLYDQHQSYTLEKAFLLPEDFTINEDMENSFSVHPPYNDLTIHILLKKHRIIHSQELTDFLNQKGGSIPPGSSPNPPPLLPALDPTFSAGSTPAPAIAAPSPQAPPTGTGMLGGYHGTGLNADGSAKPGDFVACVVDDDGEVLVQLTAMMEFCRDGSFDQCVAPLVHHLLPSDWLETSEQSFTPGSLDMVEAFDYLLTSGFNVDLPAFKDQFRDSYDVYDVTRAQHQANMSAIANPQTVAVQHHHNPVPVGPQNANFIELTGQELAVQTALEAARAVGVKGLEQEGKWDDQEEIEEKWEKSYYLNNHDGFIELERSHALWLLYEHYDNGSGLAWPNFFGMDNSRVADELFKIMDLDLEDWEEDYGEEEEHPIVLIDDHQPYPAPYDLPVPAYVPPPVQVIPPSIQTSKVPPKATPSNAPRPSFKGPVTGSGSFAPVSSGPVSKKNDDDEYPADATNMRHDAGEEWPEFCGEVWDNYSTNGPGAIMWIDRFRPRHARIIGLGYKFVRVEFTGILVQMGYLNDKFELIHNIDIPGAVFDEVLQDFGGDWNDDENVQFIHKRKGVDEDGFSFSSQNLWDEIEPLLKSKGWLAAK